jgi:hypothetical protein
MSAGLNEERMSAMLTLEKTTTTTPVTDAEAAPLTTAEANTLLTLSATQEKTPSVKAGIRTTRAWRTAGNVD